MWWAAGKDGHLARRARTWRAGPQPAELNADSTAATAADSTEPAWLPGGPPRHRVGSGLQTEDPLLPPAKQPTSGPLSQELQGKHEARLGTWKERAAVHKPPSAHGHRQVSRKRGPRPAHSGRTGVGQGSRMGGPLLTQGVASAAGWQRRRGCPHPTSEAGFPVAVLPVRTPRELPRGRGCSCTPMVDTRGREMAELLSRCDPGTERELSNPASETGGHHHWAYRPSSVQRWWQGGHLPQALS